MKRCLTIGLIVSGFTLSVAHAIPQESRSLDDFMNSLKGHYYDNDSIHHHNCGVNNLTTTPPGVGSSGACPRQVEISNDTIYITGYDNLCIYGSEDQIPSCTDKVVAYWSVKIPVDKLKQDDQHQYVLRINFQDKLKSRDFSGINAELPTCYATVGNNKINFDCGGGRGSWAKTKS